MATTEPFRGDSGTDHSAPFVREALTDDDVVELNEWSHTTLSTQQQSRWSASQAEVWGKASFVDVPKPLSKEQWQEQSDVAFTYKDNESLPEALSKLRNITRLYIQDCANINSIPDLNNLKHLRELVVTKCAQLKGLPQLPEQLMLLHVTKCETFEYNELLHQLKQQRFLQILALGNMAAADLDLTHVKHDSLQLWGCDDETTLVLPSELKAFTLRDCTKSDILEALPEGLQDLYLERVSKVSTLNTLPKGLECLSLDDCPGIATHTR
eukprot:1095-Heterococcus_DN1.PRE.1